MDNMLAARLMRRVQEEDSVLPEAIFGTAGSLGLQLQSVAVPVRIGLWPIVSQNYPRLALGLQCLLAYELDRFAQVRVYNMLAQVDAEPAEYRWDGSRSRFTPADWSLDGLDNNVSLWGTLQQAGDNWGLSLTVEGDEGQDTFDYSGTRMADMIGALTSEIGEITSFLGVGGQKALGDLPEVAHLDDNLLQIGLEALFDWSLRLYLHLWGQTWSEDQIEADFATLTQAMQPLNALGAWLLAHATAQFVQLVPGDESDFSPLITHAVRTYPGSSLSAAIVSEALINVGEYDAAFDLLSARTALDSPDVLAYLSLAFYYQRRGRYDDALDTFQDAIEAEVVSVELFRRYADFLVLMDYNRFPVATFVQIDPDEMDDELVLWEAIESYEAAIALEPDNPQLVNLQLHQLVDIGADESRLWERFATLIELDEENQYLPALIDALYTLEDVSDGIAVMESAISREPEHMDHYLNLAALYLVNEDSAAALNALARADKLDHDAENAAEIQRLRLLAEDPDFERRLGELTDITSAGNSLEAEDAEYLESVLERVPSMPEIYLLLARAYSIWDDSSAAIETLLDGHGHLPDDPDILALLGELLWDSDEQDLAFGYLKKGLDAHPNHVPLLAMAGQCLFEDNQQDAAKVYLARAEAISPRHPALIRARNRIAGAI